MDRNFKFSSVLIIEIIQIFILILLGSIFGVNGISELDPRSMTNILYTIISSSVTVIFGLIIANGLIKDPMGGVGVYFDGINVINLRNFGVGFLINLIPSLFIYIIGTGAAVAALTSLGTGSVRSILSILLIPIITAIASLIYQIFIAYRYYVLSDYRDLDFFSMIKKVFIVGKDLFGKTIKSYLKWLILPIIGFIILVVALARAGGGASIGVGILISILTLLFLLYILVAFIFILNQLAIYYINRADK